MHRVVAAGFGAGIIYSTLSFYTVVKAAGLFHIICISDKREGTAPLVLRYPEALHLGLRHLDSIEDGAAGTAPVANEMLAEEPDDFLRRRQLGNLD